MLSDLDSCLTGSDPRRMSRKLEPRVPLPIAVLATLVVAGCATKNEYQPPPPPKVTVAQPVVQTITDYIEETGTTEASDFVEIRARVKGFLQAINFQPNDEVKKGQLLYKIDPREYQAQVNQHQASLEIANARYQEAIARLKRGAQAFKGGAITAEEYGERRAAAEVVKAEIAGEQAGLNEAKLQLSFTNITSPIDGMVGKTLVYEGNLVGGTMATHLTTIVKYDPIYATFSISERALLDIMKTRGPRAGEGPERDSVRIYLSRAIDEGFPFEGRLEYTDLAVDESTGTYSIRGVFANSDLRIVPGLFVRVRVPFEEREAALLVPTRALGADQRGKFLLTVNAEGIVERQDVQVGSDLGDMVVIEQGITGDAWVIVDGIQKARPNSVVTVEKSEITPPEQPAERQRPAQPQPQVPSQPSQQPPSAPGGAAKTNNQPQPATARPAAGQKATGPPGE